jgi:Metallo-peptidase family M12
MLSHLVALALTPLIPPSSVSQPQGAASSVELVLDSTAASKVVKRISTDDPRALRIPRAARPATAAIELDRSLLKSFAEQGGGLLPDVPLGPSAHATLALVPIEPFATDAVVEQVTERNGRPVRRLAPLQATGTFLVGSVAGEPESRAFLCISEAGEFGCIERAGRRFVISSGPYGRGLPTVAFDISELPDGIISMSDWRCEAIEPPASDGFRAGEGGGDGGIASTACRQIRVAFDTDEEFLTLFAGNNAAALGYVATLSTALNAIYTRDLNARIVTSYVRIWPDPPDPWDRSGLVDQLVQLRTRWQTESPASRDMVQLLMGRSLGGGIAWVSGICSSYSYSVASGLSGYFPTPLVNNSSQNWDIMVSAHEIGHGLDMSHTHQLLPPVDGCGNSPADCTVASAGQGTIMSYCHLCGGGLTNIRLEFHPDNIAESLAFLGNAPCNYSGPAVPPIAVADSATGFIGLPTRIDVLANELGLNCEALVISAFSATSARGATITRSVGTGPDGRDELQYSLPATAGAGTDTFSYTVRDTSGQTATTSVSVNALALRTPDNPVGTTPALDARYYTIAGETALPDYALRTPYALGAIASLNYPASVNTFASSGRSDFVGARFNGSPFHRAAYGRSRPRATKARASAWARPSSSITTACMSSASGRGASRSEQDCTRSRSTTSSARAPPGSSSRGRDPGSASR